MQAKIVRAERQSLPQLNAATDQDEPTLCAVTIIGFYKKDGTLYHTQTYAQRPEDA
jgi:hypothetical protein